MLQRSPVGDLGGNMHVTLACRNDLPVKQPTMSGGSIYLYAKRPFENRVQVECVG